MNPILVEVTRGGIVESWHRGAAAVVDSAGRLVAEWGDVERPVFPRSAVKPLQALPLLESGAADAFAVTSPELALACASHAGEAMHLQCVAAWLHRLGLNPEDLACGPHPPLSEAAATDLLRRGDKATRLHNNCSGKHAGFLTLARHLGVPTRGYEDPAHPVQRQVLETLSALTGYPTEPAAIAVDGCGVPVVAVPTQGLAQAFALLATPDRLPPARRAAVQRVVAAMTGHPLMIAGAGCFDTLAVEAGAGALLVKGGAEAVACAALPNAGLGIALKVDDGGKRAADAAMAALLLHFLPESRRLRQTLERFAHPTLHNTCGQAVGEVRLVAGWPSA